MEHQRHRGLETFGPPDLRSIEADDIHEMSHEITKHLRAVMPAAGHRMAVMGALSAILSGVIVLGELGGDDAVVDTLRRHLGTAEQRTMAARAGARKEVLQ